MNTDLLDASAVYRTLRSLQPGMAVPTTIYVADYATGARPAWLVMEREDLSADGVRLLLCDPANGDMFDQPGVVVLTFPAKTLRTPVQLHGVTGPAVVGAQLCDMLQQARIAHKGHTHR